LNRYYGNGLASSKDSPAAANSNNFGVGLIFSSNDNLIEENKIGGNVNGVYIDASGDTGNKIRRNIIVGNPPVQVSATFGASVGADIQDMSALGSNTFVDNRCLTYVGAGPSLCPNIGKPLEGEDREQEEVAAFGRNRLAFPHAQLVEAVFHGSPGPWSNGIASSQPRQVADLNFVRVTGKVVDAACFMLHAQAASSASHMDCGAACLARGVPLAIAAADGTLYFPADGNQQLKALLNAHVRASGTVVEKHEPMELKMPVGEKNQMVVRIDGGYNQITLRTLEKIAAAKP
jgi:parallel beta-helix repeat protein